MQLDSRYEDKLQKMEKGKIKPHKDGYYTMNIGDIKLRAKTPNELRRRIEKCLIEMAVPEAVRDMTVRDLLSKYYDKKENSPRVQPQTLKTYEYYIKIADELFGKYKVVDLKTSFIEDVLQKYANTPQKHKNGNKTFYISKQVLDHVISTLSAAMEIAIKDEVIIRNPCNNLEVSPHKEAKVGENAHRYLDDEEIQRVFEFKHKMQLPAIILLQTGIRPEELCALRYEDIVTDDTGMSWIHINRVAILDSSEPSRLSDEAKTKASKRAIPLAEPLKTMLLNEQKQHKPSDYILPNKDGKLISKTQLRSYWNSYMLDMDYQYGNPPGKSKYSSKRKKAGFGKYDTTIKRINMYDFRHTCVTKLSNAAVPEHIRLAFFGHKDTAVEYTNYIHWDKVDTTSVLEAVAQPDKH